jgi:hypothetical protein
MSNDNVTESDITFSERIILEVGQRASRRGVLHWVGKRLLQGMGITFVPFAILDRSQQVTAQDLQPDTVDCSYFALCFLCGTYCGQNSCPAGLTQSTGSWSGCCTSGPNHLVVQYYDCCGTTSNPCPKGPGWCPGCTAGCPQTAWCSPYICSLAVVTQTKC